MKPKVIIIIEGGIVQNVLTNDKQLEYSVIDYDTDGLHDSDMTPVPQGGGREDIMAYIYGKSEPQVMPNIVEELIKLR